MAEGDLRRAIPLYERVWRFAEALPLAERLGDPALAIRLALDAGDSGRAAAIAEAIAADRRGGAGCRQRGVRRPGALRRGGRAGRTGGVVRTGGGAVPARGRCRWRRRAPWSEPGCGTTPVDLYEEVAREAAEDGDQATAAEARLALGALLGRLGRPRDAVRALQAAARHPAPPRPPPAGCAWSWVPWGCPTPRTRSPAGCTQAHPELPDSAAAIAELELQARSGRVLSAEPLRRFGELRLIGAGTLGRVYQAEDRLLGETVVLKILAVGAGGSGEERLAFRRFLREAEASSRLRHPHVVRLRDVDERAGILVLEYLPGRHAGRRRWPSTAAATRRRCAGWRSSCCRRWPPPTGRASSTATSSRPTSSSMPPATPSWPTSAPPTWPTSAARRRPASSAPWPTCQPEQISGAPIGPGADLYGLAVTLFEALTGRLPFLGPDIVGQHLAEPPPPASALQPRAVDGCTTRCCCGRWPRARRSLPLGRRHGRGRPRLARHQPVRPRGACPPGRRRDPTPTPVVVAATGRRAHRASSRPPASRWGPPPAASCSPPATCTLAAGCWSKSWTCRCRRPRRLALMALARAGGPLVQRVLALGEDHRSIVYEAIDGPLAAGGGAAPGGAGPSGPGIRRAGGGGRPLARRPARGGERRAGPVIQVVAPGGPSRGYAARP